ncbi:phosphotransferase family protein [Paenibacillus sp. IHBB 10380]|uniref:phosphotransferase family protein n=1 Tax=Paenibacillus sp. IHBB 10380 TaxID=1566358 RepID=UPI0005CF964F|nr:phosphotransferase [Paenibacillus sp. IHBB 10380]AJS58872.1 aminoglycoside phosphotransferase [Paenibacillus sp. IHBB 10380]
MGIKLGLKIGEGGCSEVFELEDSSKLIKLAKANTDYDAMSREYQNNVIAWEKGLSVARPYELLEIDGRPGIVFERIHGETLMERFLTQALNQMTSTSDINGEDIRLTARILSEIHNVSDARLSSSQRENITYSIHSVGYLTLLEKESIISILESLPSKQVLCHGDPNPGNFMKSSDGKAVAIDWMNASIGNPEADLAEYIIMIRYAILPSHFPSRVTEFFDSIRESIINIFMDEYTELTGISYNEVYPWFIPVAARKLSADAISEDEKNLLIQEIRRNLTAEKSREDLNESSIN